jgi:phospholipid/cholesterol/gamma-HCH transport system substrate-binding protein
MASARPRRGRRPRRSPVAIGLAALAVLAAGLYLGFTKDLPFTRGFELRAQFASANAIRPGAPVRIAGVDVGKVRAVEPLQGTDAAVLRMELEPAALPLHRDATAKIRPRIFLEGNFFVDLRPGTRSAPVLDSGDTLSIAQTATPVQLDEVLTALQSDSREDLQALIEGLSRAMHERPTRAQDAESDPSARGETGARSLNDAYADLPAAERSTAQVLDALLGTEPDRDVARLLRGTGATAEQLTRHEGRLQDLVTNANRTMAALAARQGDLRATIRALAPTLARANRALASLDAAFPATRAFAREVLPGVRATPGTIDAAFPWIAQARRLVARTELGGLAGALSPASADLARLADRAQVLLPRLTAAARCVRDKVLPTGNVPIRDEFATGVENYKEFFYALVGLAGEGQNADGNGTYVRFQTGGGDQRVTLTSPNPARGRLYGNDVAVPLGNRPAYPGRKPPYRPGVPCTSTPLPNLNGPAAAASAPGGGRR